MFIQIQDRIINTDHIVMAEIADVDYNDNGRRDLRLRITLTGTQPGDFGQHPVSISFYRHEAEILWGQLQYYLSPTVIGLA